MCVASFLTCISADHQENSCGKVRAGPFHPRLGKDLVASYRGNQSGTWQPFFQKLLFFERRGFCELGKGSGCIPLTTRAGGLLSPNIPSAGELEERVFSPCFVAQRREELFDQGSCQKLPACLSCTITTWQVVFLEPMKEHPS